jgi:hypothetical protein
MPCTLPRFEGSPGSHPSVPITKLAHLEKKSGPVQKHLTLVSNFTYHGEVWAKTRKYHSLVFLPILKVLLYRTSRSFRTDPLIMCTLTVILLIELRFFSHIYCYGVFAPISWCKKHFSPQNLVINYDQSAQWSRPVYGK